MRSFDVKIDDVSVLDEGMYCVASYSSLFPVCVACKGKTRALAVIIRQGLSEKGREISIR